MTLTVGTYEAGDIVAEFIRARQDITLGGLSIEKLKAEGRR